MRNDFFLPPAEFDTIYGKVPRLTVEAVVQVGGGIVLTRRTIAPCRGQWHIPGGTVRFGESLRDAVRRVARHELCVEVEVGDLLGYIEYPEMLRSGYPGWPVGIAFAASVLSGELASGDQSDGFGVFHSVPPDTISEQAAFLAALFAARRPPGAGTPSPAAAG